TTSRTSTTASRQSGETAALVPAAARVTVGAGLLLRGQRAARRGAVAPAGVDADRALPCCLLLLLRGLGRRLRRRLRGGLVGLRRGVPGDPLVHDPPRR